jgi:hypothetical protein
MRDERGVALPELLVAITAGIAVLFGVFTMSEGTLRGSARVQQRVDATQRSRPVLTHILDELHSSCISPNISPVLPGSTGSSITFLHKTGTAVTPNPDKRVISLTGTTMSESVYPYLSGSAPDWIFGATPTTTRLLTNVGSGSVGGAAVPLFRYYAYNSTTGAIDPTPLTTPLSSDDADRTVQVDVAFSSAPTKTRVVENNTALTSYDSVLFRFSPAAEDASQSQLPCT